MSRPGKLKHRIEVQENQPSKDTLGGYEPNWVSIATTWAKVDVETGTRALEYLQAYNGRPYTITMRQDIELNPNTMKVIYKGKDLIINSVETNEDKYTYQIVRASEKIV